MAKTSTTKSFYIRKMHNDLFVASPKRGKLTKGKVTKLCACGDLSCFRTEYGPNKLTGAGQQTRFCDDMGYALTQLGFKLKEGEAIRVSVRRLK